MDERDLPGNSHRQRGRPIDETPEPRSLEPVVRSGSVKRRKRSLGKRFVDTFVGTREDDEGSWWEYMIFERFIPEMRLMIWNNMTDGIEHRLFGRSLSHRGGGTPYRGGRPDYRGRFQEDRRDEGRRTMSRGARARHDFGELVFDTRVEAEEVLDAMFNEISQYDVVTVRALLELCDYETNAVDRRWGWTDIRGTDIVRMRDGSYLLDLRPPEPIE